MTTLTPQTRPSVAPAEAEPEQLYGYMAEFDTPAAIMHAAEKVRDSGYRWWDCHTPFPVHGLDKAMGIKATWLPLFVFGAGVTGALLGIVLQWFTNASGFDFWALVPVRGYEFLISGKPTFSLPASVPVIFELTILLSATSCVGLMLFFNGLPRFYHPTLKSERFRRVTDDRFFLVLEARDPLFTRTKARSLLESLDPLSIEALEA